MDQHSMMRGRQAFRSDIDIAFDELRGILDAQYQTFNDLKRDETRCKSIFNRFMDFPWSEVEEKLQRAQRLIDKKGYMVAILGTFSSGKSSLSNALLKMPGFLPESQGVCTLSVSELRGTTSESEQGMNIKYLTKEGSFKKVFGSDLFIDTLKKHLSDLDPFNEKKAKDYVSEAQAYYANSPEEDMKEKGQRLGRFLAALETYADRLNRNHSDTLDNKDNYLSAQGKKGSEGADLNEGHLFLIDRVEITLKNDLLTADDVVWMDLPGVDAPSVRDKEVTFEAIEDADAAIIVVPDRGFASADKELIQRVSEFQADVKSKIFVAVNKTDILHPDQIVRFEAEFMPGLEQNVHTMGVDMGKIFFTSAFLGQQLIRFENGELSGDEKKEFENWRQALEDKKRLIREKIASPAIKERLLPVFENGAINRLRDSLQEYLKYDIRKERIKEIFLRLHEVQNKFDWMMAPERGKIDSISQLREERVGEFFYEIKEQIESGVNDYKDMKLEKVVNQAVGGFRNNAGNFAANIFKKALFRNFGNIVSRAMPKTVSNVKSAALNEFKPQIVDIFKKTIREQVPALILGEVKKILEEKQIYDILSHFTEKFLQAYNDQYSAELEFLERSFNLVTELRVDEILQPVYTAINIGNDTRQWSPSMKDEFQDFLIEKYTDMFQGFTSQLGVLKNYYNALLEKFVEKVKEVFEKIHSYASERLANNVELPRLHADAKDAKEEVILQQYADQIGKSQEGVHSFKTQIAAALNLNLS